jgi:hypothetical protein
MQSRAKVEGLLSQSNSRIRIKVVYFGNGGERVGKNHLKLEGAENS